MRILKMLFSKKFKEEYSRKIANWIGYTKLDRRIKCSTLKKRGEQICLEKFAVASQMISKNKSLTCTMQVENAVNWSKNMI